MSTMSVWETNLDVLPTAIVQRGKSVPIISASAILRHVVSTTTVGAGIIVRTERVLRAFHVDPAVVRAENIVMHKTSVCITIMSVLRIPTVRAGIIVRLEDYVR